MVESFLDEAAEHLAAIESGLVHFDDDVVSEIFREVHSIKGGAGGVGLKALARFAHRMESVLARVRDGSRAITPDLTELLLRATDILREFLDGHAAGADLPPAAARAVEAELAAATTERDPAGPRQARGAGTLFDITLVPHPDLVMGACVDPFLVLHELDELGALDVSCDFGAVPELEDLEVYVVFLRWHLRLRTEAPEERVREVLEWTGGAADFAIRAASAEPSAKATEKSTGATRRPRTSIRVDAAKIDAVLNLVGELVITNARLRDEAQGLPGEAKQSLGEGIQQLEEQTRSLQETVLAMRMVPTQTVFERLPRVVFDTARTLGKEVDLRIEGEWTEVDREVVQLLADPLVHMVRNAVDHGLELPDVRERAGKPRTGTLLVRALHHRGDVLVVIQDDGRGIDRTRLRRRAEEIGMVVPGDPTEVTEEILLRPGFTTAAEVTDVSGRGVGLDVVNRNVSALGGSLAIESEVGKGTTFQVRLPMTLAILDGQLVRVGEETYVVPVRSIVECFRPDADLMRRVPGSGAVYQLRGVQLPVVSLTELFSVPGGEIRPEASLFVVVDTGKLAIALAVDDLGPQQQVVLKQLERNYRRVPGLAGATILGDGRIALVVDPTSIGRGPRSVADRGAR